MKKKFKIIILLLTFFLFVGLNEKVYAVTTYVCNNMSDDTCEKKDYKYDQEGNTKSFSITLGVLHYNNMNPSNTEKREYIAAFDSCLASNDPNFCSTDPFRFYLPTESKATIAVDSDTNSFPIAICAFPYNGGSPLNQALLEDNVKEYTYFTQAEIDNAISNGKCTSENIYYREVHRGEVSGGSSSSGSGSTTITTTICTKPTSRYKFNSTTDLSGVSLSTHYYKTGDSSICEISYLKDSKTTHLYNYYNSVKTCASSSFEISCKSSSGGYECNLNECNNAADNTSTTSSVTKKCTLYNAADTSDTISFAFIPSTKEKGKYNYLLEYKSKSVSFSTVGNTNFKETKSCPEYVIYDNNTTKYSIADSQGLQQYQNEHSSNSLTLYKFKNVGDSTSLSKDELNDYLSGLSNFDIELDDADADKCQGILTDEMIDILNRALKYIRIAAPILLVIFGCIDFGKAVLSDDKDELKKATSKFTKRAIIVVAIFFVPLIVGFLIDAFNSVSDKSITDLINCGIK